MLHSGILLHPHQLEVSERKSSLVSLILIPSSQMYGCESSSLFAIKAMMREIPFKFNMIVMSLSLVIFGQALRICEAPISRITNEMNHFSLENSIWAVILTMTTGILEAELFL